MSGMKKTPQTNETYSEKEALERMNKALKGAMEKPPKSHKEMVKKRRAEDQGRLLSADMQSGLEALQDAIDAARKPRVPSRSTVAKGR